MVTSELDLKWSLDLFDALDILDSWSDSTMYAEDSLLLMTHDGGEWQVIEDFIDLRENRVRVVDVLS